MSTELEEKWVGILTNALNDLVPGEKFEVVVEVGDDDRVRLEVKTESKRVLVAWSELMHVLEQGPPENS